MNNRLPSVPLITCDPYLSLWSPCDKLHDGDTCHWTGVKKPAYGKITIDGTAYRFMGSGNEPVLEQTALTVTPTASTYSFLGNGVNLNVRFTSPLLMDDLVLMSRPVSFVEFKLTSVDGATHHAAISLTLDESHCYEGDTRKPLIYGVHECGAFEAAWMGLKKQAPLSHSGDGITIDWGYLYLASSDFVVGCNNGERTTLTATLDTDVTAEPIKRVLAVAYDDIASIQYFGRTLRGYWTIDGDNIMDAIATSLADYRAIVSQCDVFDESLIAWAARVGGEEYSKITSAAYRQSIAAHKLAVDDNGDAIFVSKECFSNGCAATADVSYPSIPLYLIYEPELVKGMLRPVFEFAKMPVWEFDFAPHDAGRFPYVWGQVYGTTEGWGADNGDVHAPFYNFPKGSNIYEFKYQMPVEECGNMLIMAAAAAVFSGDAEFLRDELPSLKKWVSYLIEFGVDPGNQLCTDDFAGHLAHNANLAAKATNGVLAYSIIISMLGDETLGVQYLEKARTMAKEWAKNADAGDHTVLSFGDQSSWGLKYNLVWDIVFGAELFPKSIYEREVAWYQKMSNAYGVPLDNRKDYTKSDWILWVAAFADNQADMQKLIAPVAKFLCDSPQRNPFSDWYETKTAEQVGFQNRTVQGGLFMPLLKDLMD